MQRASIKNASFVASMYACPCLHRRLPPSSSAMQRRWRCGSIKVQLLQLCHNLLPARWLRDHGSRLAVSYPILLLPVLCLCHGASQLGSLCRSDRAHCRGNTRHKHFPVLSPGGRGVLCKSQDNRRSHQQHARRCRAEEHLYRILTSLHGHAATMQAHMTPWLRGQADSGQVDRHTL